MSQCFIANKHTCVHTQSEPLPARAATGASSRSTPYDIVVAAGPFCPSDSLDFSAFSQLIRSLARSPPDVLVLVGPFLDLDGNKVLPRSRKSFEERFRASLAKWLVMLNRPQCHVVVVPALSDATTTTYALPQPPLPRSLFAQHLARLTLAPNPCVLALDGGVTLGVTSTDIVKHTATRFVQQQAAQTDRLRNICAALVAERSFYPLDPCDDDVALHTAQRARLAFPGYTPDVLVLPSDLRPFAYELPLPGGGACTCVNPRRLVAGVELGRFAHIVVDPSTRRVTRVASMQL